MLILIKPVFYPFERGLCILWVPGQVVDSCIRKEVEKNANGVWFFFVSSSCFMDVHMVQVSFYCLCAMLCVACFSFTGFQKENH